MIQRFTMNDTNRIHCILHMDLASMADTCVCKTVQNDAGPSTMQASFYFTLITCFPLVVMQPIMRPVDLL